MEESRFGEGNLELCLDDIIEGRWNDGVVCLRSLKGSIEIFFVVLVLFESLVFGGLYVINLMDTFARDIYGLGFSFFLEYLYENNLDIVIVGKKNETFVYVFDILVHLWPSTFSNLRLYPSHISSRRRFLPLIY